VALANLGDFTNALQDCNHALVLAPHDAATLDSRGFVYLTMQNYDLAIADYNAALKENPKLASSLYGLGLAMRAKGETGAGEKIAMAEKLDPAVTSDFGK
jgi:tetratricopeptide (TPR) repeat protein